MKRRKTWHQLKRPQPAPGEETWTPFEKCDEFRDADGVPIAIPVDITVWKNNLYTVQCRRHQTEIFGEPLGMMWLSIKRNDRAPLHDWRQLQWIKNELCGPECEAMELYPAESRLVDTSNQYHLFVLPAGVRLPFGFTERLVIDHDPNDTNPLTRAAVQRPFPADRKPPDTKTSAEALAQLTGRIL